MISGQINAQVFPLSGADQYQGTADFDGGTSNGMHQLPRICRLYRFRRLQLRRDATEDDGTCEFTSCAGCTDATACNHDPAATLDDSSCTSQRPTKIVMATFGGRGLHGECGGTAVVDECGVCGGGGIPAGDRDCDGNVADAIGVMWWRLR